MGNKAEEGEDKDNRIVEMKEGIPLCAKSRADGLIRGILHIEKDVRLEAFHDDVLRRQPYEDRKKNDRCAD